MSAPIKVFLMNSEVGYASRELSNKLYKNLTANLVIKTEQVLDEMGKPVVLEGIREAWVMNAKGKMEKKMVPTLSEVWVDKTLGINISPFVAGSISKRRSDMIAERQDMADPFDVDSDELPVTQFTKPINLEKEDLTGLEMAEIISKLGGTAVDSLAESVVYSQEKNKKTSFFQKVVDRLVKTGEHKVISDAAIETTGMNIDVYYEGLTAREQQFLHDTLISRSAGWADNRTDEEKEIARQKEQRYQDDLKALKAKYADGFYHGDSEPIPLKEVKEEEPEVTVLDLPDLN